METLEALAEMLETTSDIKSIVRTMKSLSAVSIRQYEQAEAAMSRYEQTIDMGLTALLQHSQARGMSLSSSVLGPSTNELLIVIGSDRGLCGSYNEIVVRHAVERLQDEKGTLAVIGVRAGSRLGAMGHEPDHLFLLPGSVSGISPLVQRIIIKIESWQRERGVGCVHLVHNRREGRSQATSVERALLPLPESYLQMHLEKSWPGSGLPFIRMHPERLLSFLVRQRLFVVLYRALAEALASEHATRLAAMQSAERNIEERRKHLESDYRRVRQQTVTRELMDVIAGYEAVSGSEG